MKKSLFIAALATLALASCSKNEVLELKQDQIKFSAVADNASRGTVIKTNTLESFNVWGWVEQDNTTPGDYETPYFANVNFSKQNDNSFASTTNYWWPEGAMKFYATNFDDNLASGNFEYTVNETVASQEDLLYAAAFNVGKNNTENGLYTLNFRHALSQIVFQVGLDEVGSNQPIQVTINSIKLTGLDGTATFTMPTENTNDPDYSDDPDNSLDTEISGKGWGTWVETTLKESGFTAKNYIISLEKAIRNGNITNSTAEEVSNYVAYGTEPNGTMLLIPQGLSGATMVVDCKIETAGVNGMVTLHNGKLTHNFADDDAWKQGKKYVYKIKFGATLQAIKFSVTVDEYQLGTTTPIEFN